MDDEHDAGKPAKSGSDEKGKLKGRVGLMRGELDGHQHDQKAVNRQKSDGAEHAKGFARTLLHANRLYGLGRVGATG